MSLETPCLLYLVINFDKLILTKFKTPEMEKRPPWKLIIISVGAEGKALVFLVKYFMVSASEKQIYSERL